MTDSCAPQPKLKDSVHFQVSYESTAEILSDNIRFPSFLRTVPSDFYQTKAMAHLIQQSGWNWVGAITTGDDYGRLALNTFAIQAAANNVCIAFKEVLPAFLSDNTTEVRINQTVEKIIAEAQVNVIVVFLRKFHVFSLFTKAIERKISKVWIASDNWSTAAKIISIPNVKKLGKVVGFTFRRGNMSSFHSFLQTLHVHPNDNNKPLHEFAVIFSACKHIKDDDLSQSISNYSQATLTYDIPRPLKTTYSKEMIFSGIILSLDSFTAFSLQCSPLVMPSGICAKLETARNPTPFSHGRYSFTFIFPVVKKNRWYGSDMCCGGDGRMFQNHTKPNCSTWGVY